MNVFCLRRPDLGKISLFVLLVMALMPAASQACSTFYLADDTRPVFGKNYDWSVDDGLVIVNKRHVAKTAAGEQSALTWTSKYGSITFNQYGREFTHGGMNEAGLVVELMWLEETQYPAQDERFGIDCLQWVQYQLDNFSTVAEVRASDTKLRISPGGAPLHYLVCDGIGACATVEFLGGRTVTHTGDELPVQALTNSTYASSVAFLQECEGFGGLQPISNGSGSLDRFARAAKLLQQGAGADPVAAAFDILANVAQGAWTKWSIVYDMAGGEIFFRTYTNPNTRSIDFAAFDFDCSTPVEVLNINAPGTGDVRRQFEAYTFNVNRELLGNAYGKTEFLRGTPSSVLDGIAAYPEEETTCQRK